MWSIFCHWNSLLGYVSSCIHFITESCDNCLLAPLLPSPPCLSQRSVWFPLSYSTLLDCWCPLQWMGCSSLALALVQFLWCLWHSNIWMNISTEGVILTFHHLKTVFFFNFYGPHQEKIWGPSQSVTKILQCEQCEQGFILLWITVEPSQVRQSNTGCKASLAKMRLVVQLTNCRQSAVRGVKTGQLFQR